MQDNKSYRDEQEKLREENEFLKLKLMLEHGAGFGGSAENDLPPEVENQFLQNVIAFEKQFQERKTIKLFDKIGRPDHFKPQAEISDEEINEAWQELKEYLNNNGIDLSVCSPNISSRELYRFAIEELFTHEMDDMDMPGWFTHFIYDEFYPDLVYDNTRVAEDCIKMIFSKEPLEWMTHFKRSDLRLNSHYPMEQDELKMIINRFKESHDEISLHGIYDVSCVFEKNFCYVNGKYEVCGKTGNEELSYSGDWKISLEKDPEFEYWDINAVQIGGIEF